MKRIILTIASIAMLLLCLCALCSCEEQLSAPAGVKINGDTLMLEWRRVPGAKAYTVSISGSEREYTTQANYYSLENLDPGEYVVKVCAVSPSEDFKDSEWVSVPFVREEESGLRFKLINNKTEYQVTGGGTAFGDVVIENVYRGKPVTSIADKAFSGNKKITSLVIQDNMRTIGKNAFTKCAELTSIEIPDTVTSIGQYAFQSCKKLKSISLPENMTVLSPYMFSWCDHLEAVEFGSKLTSIGEYSFSNCEALTSIIIPDTVTTIGEYAFSDCLALSKVSIGNGVSSIGDYVFLNCAAITDLTLGTSIRSFGESAFSGCSSITELALPEAVETIGIYAFFGCTNLETVTIGDNVKSIGVSAFGKTKLMENADNYVTIGGWLLSVKDREISTITLPQGVYGIADYCFAACPNLLSITLSNVKYVGAGAFMSCGSLWEIIFDNNLLTIGDSAFMSCTHLTNITVGNSLQSIGDFAFSSCNRLASMSLPDSLTVIGTRAFEDTLAYTSASDVVYMDDWAVGIKPNYAYSDIIIKDGTRGIANHSFYQVIVGYSIMIPDSVLYIGTSAFYQSGYVQSIYISKNVKRIGDYAFYGCSRAWFGPDGITTIPGTCEYIGRSAFYKCVLMVGLNIPGSVKTIGDFAFFGCENLGESYLYYQEKPDEFLKGDVILNEGIESIGSRAFYNCARIASITIPGSIKNLGERVFYKCANLKEVSIADGVTVIPQYTFYNCTSLTNVNISDSVTEIGGYAFRGCSALSDITIGSNVEKIGDFAFYSCSSLTHVILPQSLKSIGNYAFRGCSSFNGIVIPSTVEVIGKHAFYGLPEGTLYCESETVNPYWDERFNSSYRAIFFGVQLSEDKTYVESITVGENNPDNADVSGGITAPWRDGYTFVGWALAPDSKEIAYTSYAVIECPVGTTLYAVYIEGEPVVELPEEEETVSPEGSASSEAN